MQRVQQYHRSGLVGALTVLLLAAAAAAGGSAAGASAADAVVTGSHFGGRVLLVDDDRAQCPRADFTSVQAALDRARNGDRIRVCAGRYAEQLTIDRSVTLQGQIGAVASYDCLDATPGTLDDLDPTRFAILEPSPDPGVEPSTHVRVAADDVELAGFVVQGLVDDTPSQPSPGVDLYDAAISVSDSHSGTRLHHNLVRENTLGVELGGSGRRPSRVDHNCFRDNSYAVANQRYHLADARIDDNTTFRTEIITFEIGWSYAGTTDVRIDHNLSVDHTPAVPGFAVVYVDNSTRARVDTNEVRTGARGIHVAPTNADVRVAGNTVRATEPGRGTHGIVIATTAGRPPSRHVVIADNTVSVMGGIGILVATNAQQTDAVVKGNVATGNVVDGIVVGGSNTGNRFSGNVTTGNAGIGLRMLPGATGNLLTDNTALGNTTDAVDQGAGAGSVSLANSWVRTTCVTDVPTGLICTPPRTTSVSR